MSTSAPGHDARAGRRARPRSRSADRPPLHQAHRSEARADASGNDASGRAAPAALRMRPQFGSQPYMAVLTSGESATARRHVRASSSAGGPAHPQAHHLGGALAVGDHHQRQPQQQRPQGGAQLRGPVGREVHARGAVGQQEDPVVGAHLPVDRDAVERAPHLAGEQAARPRADSRPASVVTTHSMVAMPGAIMPAPLAAPARRTTPSRVVDLERALLGEAVGGHDALGERRTALAVTASRRGPIPATTTGSGSSGTPMTPVEPTPTR